MWLLALAISGKFAAPLRAFATPSSSRQLRGRVLAVARVGGASQCLAQRVVHARRLGLPHRGVHMDHNSQSGAIPLTPAAVVAGTESWHSLASILRTAQRRKACGAAVLAA
jgi:hypothetical protein